MYTRVPVVKCLLRSKQKCHAVLARIDLPHADGST